MKTNTINRERTEVRPVTVAIPARDGRRVAERITVGVPMRWDSDLEKWLLDGNAMEMIEDAKARHMGLMLPAEMLALRKRLGLSQRDIGELLRIGAKSWTRWESGLQRPSQSINLLLRLLDSGIISPRQLLDVGCDTADWTPQFLLLAKSNQATAPVSLDQWRATYDTEVDELLTVLA